MNLKKITSLTSFLILVSLIPNSFASSLNSTLDQQGNYLNPTLGIGFQVPQGWLVEEPKKTQPDAPDIAVIAPYSEEFTPAISFTIEKANNTSLGDYFENKKNEILYDASSKNITFMSEQDGTIKGYNTKIAILKEDFTTQGKNITIKFKDVFVLAGGNFYTITYANEEKNFDSFISTYDNLLNSITFTNQQDLVGTNSLYVLVGIGVAITIGIALVIRRKRTRAQ